MTKIEINFSDNLTAEEIQKVQEIFIVLLQKGGLLGVKNGSTNIHFDKDGTFQGIQFDYWPWKRRKS
jgi:hypothetical protein